MTKGIVYYGTDGHGPAIRSSELPGYVSEDGLRPIEYRGNTFNTDHDWVLRSTVHAAVFRREARRSRAPFLIETWLVSAEERGILFERDLEPHDRHEVIAHYNQRDYLAAEALQKLARHVCSDVDLASHPPLDADGMCAHYKLTLAPDLLNSGLAGEVVAEIVLPTDEQDPSFPRSAWRHHPEAWDEGLAKVSDIAEALDAVSAGKPIPGIRKT